MQHRTTPWTYLRTLRLRARLSHAELAERVSRSAVHIRAVERGAVGASDELLGCFADVFCVDIMELDRTQPTVPPRTGTPRRHRTGVSSTSGSVEVA